MSLSEARNGLCISLFQLEVARAMEAQLVITVNYIHSRGCFVHGDLHCGNILIQLLRELDHRYIYGKVIRPVWGACAQTSQSTG
jgi:hypothetical protein